MSSLIHIRNVKIVRSENTVFESLDFDLSKFEHSLIVGTNGSGKSTFLKLLKGELYPYAGQGTFELNIGGITCDNPNLVREKIGYVSAEQQQFYPRMEIKIPGLEVIESGFGEGIFVYTPLTEEQKNYTKKIISDFKIEKLLSKNFNDCSNGEQKKLLLARAIVKQPELLILDEFENGLDSTSQAEFFELLESLSNTGITILFCTHHLKTIPSFIKKIFKVENKKITEVKNSELKQTLSKTFNAKPEINKNSKTLIKLTDCNVFYDLKQALFDINFEVRSGHHYLITGANGSGKSTFLKLLTGDVHPVVSGIVTPGKVEWPFDKTPNQTLWDIKAKMGLVSPHLQTDYYENITFEETVLSGLYSSIGIYRAPTEEDISKVKTLAKKFLCEHLLNKNFMQLSYGQTRKALILRAVINNPEILILDEPFDGLDSANVAQIEEMLNEISANTTIIIVTHNTDEIPTFITDRYTISNGRIALQK